MSIFDFLLGTPKQQTYEPEITGARNELLARIMENLDRGPINMPTYFAPTPSARYAGANNLLASLGLDQVNPSLSLPLTDVGGVQAYSTQALADQMLEAYREQYPEEYAAAMNRKAMNTMAQNAPVSSNNDNDDDPLERHYSIFPDERPRTGPYADPNKPSGITYSGDYPTMGSMPAIRGYTTPDLGPVGNFVDDIKSAGRGIARDVGKIASSGGLIGSILGGR